ncbi:MAG: hypothetical protein K2N44_19820 [Lachnospiraceae bacterium]|nr:hypothetical protein [Lachnospiraceae bacterium]
MRYVFDISDTAGREQKLTWELDGEHAAAYMEYLKNKGAWGEKPGAVADPQKKNLI